MDESVKTIEQKVLEISGAKTLEELDKIFLDLLGKQGLISQTTQQFAKLEKSEVSKFAPIITKLRITAEAEITQRREQVREESYKQLTYETLDLDSSNLEFPKRQGHLHPVSKFESEIIKLFSKLGFQQFDAPHIDTDYNNFEALNIPENHPARDLWDTLYIDQSNLAPQPGKLLLRTHTSNSQVHIMKKFNPPIRMMNIGRCFRYENLDARHEHTFEQFEIVYIDKGLNMGNLQFLSEYFLKNVFGEKIKVRLKPKYYPFVEPGAGVDGECIFCHGKGCKVCGGSGWLELAGAGMIHPKVLQNGGIDPNQFSGIAWGFGPERMVMIKNQIIDLRLLKSGDLKFLQQY